MTVLVNFNGTAYLIPDVGDQNWGPTVTSYLQDLGGASLTLTASQTLSNKVLRLQGGTAAAPSLSFTTDTATGIFQPTAGQIAISTAGVQRLMINAAGQVTVPNALITGGTIDGAVIGGTTPSTATFSQITSIPTHGWSSYNYGTGLLLTGTQNPALGLTDHTGANLMAIANQSGSLMFSAMPAFANTTTAPTQLLSLSSTGAALSTSLQMPNQTPILMKDTSGTYRSVLYLGADNNTDLVNAGGAQIRFLNQTQNTALLTCDNSGNITAAGFLQVPSAIINGPVVATTLTLSGNAVVGGGLTLSGQLSTSGITVTTLTATGAASVGPATAAGHAPQWGQVLGGVNAVWNLISGRVANTAYTNTHGKPIGVTVTFTAGTNQYAIAYLNGAILKYSSYLPNVGAVSSLDLIVPVGQAYSINSSGGPLTIDYWYEWY